MAFLLQKLSGPEADFECSLGILLFRGQSGESQGDRYALCNTSGPSIWVSKRGMPWLGANHTNQPKHFLLANVVDCGASMVRRGSPRTDDFFIRQVGGWCDSGTCLP